MAVNNKTPVEWIFLSNTEETTVGQRLRALFHSLDVKQSQVARAFGRSSQHVYHIIKRGRISHDFAAWLAQYTSVNLNWLFTGRGPMFLPEAAILKAAEAEPGYRYVSNQELLRELARRLGPRGKDFLAATAPEGPPQKEPPPSNQKTTES